MENIAEKVNTEIIQVFGKTEKDSGSSEVQIAIWTSRILRISEHMKANPKDFHSRFGLIKIVSKRKRLLKYLKRKDLEGYKKLIASLGLRK